MALKISRKQKAERKREWRRIQAITTTTGGQDARAVSTYRPYCFEKLQYMLDHCLRVMRREPPSPYQIPASISSAELRPPSLIREAPTRLWLSKLDQEALDRLEAVYTKIAAEHMLGVASYANECFLRQPTLIGRDLIAKEQIRRKKKSARDQSAALGK